MNEDWTICLGFFFVFVATRLWVIRRNDNRYTIAYSQFMNPLTRAGQLYSRRTYQRSMRKRCDQRVSNRGGETTGRFLVVECAHRQMIRNRSAVY